ncbi:LOW QUALITY PROTEIN: dynein regulatory complex protein 9-like [Palaemon carinicauda]|uniref:LOW QUALITY PROTEIN: dynein regulatory complex protein 9-like n=1 Tax=Palaemon carinicauda TaxID=392227 RepID=UPI0035B5A980
MCAVSTNVVEEYKLNPKTATELSEIVKKSSLSIRLLRELLPRRPFKTEISIDDNDLEEEENDEHSNDLALRKIHDDLDIIEKVLLDLSAELRERHTFVSLENYIASQKDDAQSKADFIALFQGEKWKAKYFEKSNKLQLLQKELRAIRQDTQKLMQAKDEEIAKLRAEIEKLTDINPKRENYEKKIAKAQVENLQFRVEQEEERICKQIARVGREIPQEIRVHDALTAFLKECCAKLETKSAEWDGKFKEETDAKKEEVSAWKAEVQSKKVELEDLERMYQEYWAVVSVYEAEQEVIREKKEKAEREFKAAAKIQAWWKGYMVRKGMSSGLRKKKKSKK